jgi:high-affinity Fe2+/Pb2+ permease
MVNCIQFGIQLPVILGYTHLYYVFILIGVGVIVSVVIAFLEHLRLMHRPVTKKNAMKTTRRNSI